MNKVRLLKHYILTKYGRKFHSRHEIENYQNKKIKKHLDFIVEKSPFYLSLYSEYETELKTNHWRKLPIIDKAMMMEQFDLFNTVGIKKEEALNLAFSAEKTRDFSPKINNISIGLSSGTSGNRGLFLVSDKESEMWAGTVLAKLLPGSLLNTHRIAFFLRANNNLYSSTENGKITFHYFDLLDDFQSHKTRLQDIQPTIMIGPPSMLRKIAEWQAEHQLHISPTKIISVAEVLEDIDKKFIEAVFKQQLHQVYQCTEGFLATTCKHGTLHINEDLVAIQKEYLDRERGIFVPIITDFTRITQPIIRYRLNDLLIERKTPCPCGSQFLALERIDGRSDDLFYGERYGEKEKKVLFPDFIRRAVMLASEHILEYKVIQKELNLIEVKIKVEQKNHEQEVKERIRMELIKLWKSFYLIEPTIIFSDYNILPSDKKLKRIESRL